MKPDWLSDKRLIPDEAMSYIRKIAIHAIIENHYSPEDVVRIFGFSRSCIYDWLKRFEEGDYEGLETKKAPGALPEITDEMDVWLKHLVLNLTPESLGYDTTLWTCDILIDLLEKQYGVRVTNSAMNYHLHNLNLSNQKPNYIPREQNPEAVKEFLNQKFPKIQSFAEKAGADIGFQDEAAVDLRDRSGKTWGVVGIRPSVYVTGQRGRLNILSAVARSGDFYYRTTEKIINSKQYIEFLEQLIGERERPFFLIVDRASFHRSKQVRKFIWCHRDQIRLFYLPAYSPELNPDEHVWEEIKDKQLGRKPIKNKRDLKERANSALEVLKEKKERVISFFHLPETRYAASV